MSDRVRALVWDYYDERRFGAPRILAIALSDEADDRGGGIFQSQAVLAEKTEQTVRAIRRQLRRLECSGLLMCVEKSTGGPGQFHQYRLNLSLLLSLKNPDSGSGLTRTEGPGFDHCNPERGSGLADAPLCKESNNTSSASASGFLVPDEVDDQRVAKWIYDKLVAVNPQHREPKWPTWRRDIARMRTVDKRTRREICELFAWANGDDFWRANILSPAKLRKQWDQLTLQRMRGLAAGAGQRGATPAPKDWRCTRDKVGALCGKPGVFGSTDGSARCRECKEEEERERASAQA